MTAPRSFFLLLLLPALSAAQDETFRTAASRPVDIQHIRLDVSVDLEEQSLTGTARIDFVALQTTRQLQLDAIDHDVRGIWRLGANDRKQALEYENTGTELIVDLGESLGKGGERSVLIDYQVTEPASGLHFFKPSKAEPDVPWMAWTQGEPRHNHHWFPCRDHPSERQSTEILATVDERFRVLSNGELVKKSPLADGKIQYHWRQQKPHVSYLVTLVVGEFAVVEETWRERPVVYYAPTDRGEDVMATFGRTTEMLDFFSERFGIEYPWDQYAQVVVEQFTSGGMENTSATTLYEGVMHDERALLDSTPDRLIAHELGHQWWGDLVTCKDWAHLWLNEGFATYCEVLWWEHAHGKDEADYLLWQKSSSARSGSTQQRPIVDRFYPAPRTMFDNRAYPKAGWVLHMLRHKVGDEDFFRALQRYGTAYAFQTAETSDLRKVFAELTGLSLERFFYDWTERSGHPILSVNTSWQAEDNLVKVVVKQTQKADPFTVPLKIELLAEDSANNASLDRQITERELTVYIPMRERPRMVRVDPDYSLLTEIKETKAGDQWKEQLVRGPTVPERIRAAQHFGNSKKAADRKLLIASLKGDDFYGVRIEAAKALGRSGGDASRDALIGGLKAKHPKVRRACVDALAKFEKDEKAVAALHAALKTDERSYHVRAAVIGALVKIDDELTREVLEQQLRHDSHRDVVRQAALAGLGRVKDEQALDRLSEWSEKGHERNCRIAAMRALATYLIRNEVSPAKQTPAVERLMTCLDGEGTHVRRAAAQALGALGKLGEPAIDSLSAVAEHDADQRVRSAAESALTAIREGNADSAEVKRLRAELDTLRKQNDELEGRLLKLEAQ